MSKYLFVVDEKNNPLPQKLTRSQVHRQGFWHRTIHIWVLNHKNKLLLVKRGSWKSQDPGLWASYIGGHVLFKESYEEGALREIEEEIGIKLNSMKRLIPIYLKKSQLAREFSQYFLLRLIEKETVKPTEKEFTDYKFIKPELTTFEQIGFENISGGKKYVREQIKRLEVSQKTIKE